MNPKTLTWLSLITLVTSLVTLWMVWQMQSRLAHSDADASVIFNTYGTEYQSRTKQ